MPGCGFRVQSSACEPAGPSDSGLRSPLLGLAHFMPDNAADGRTANGSDSAAARQDGASDGTDTSTDSGALVLIRHPGASAQTEQQGCD
jgi:hypothetical protein